MLVGKEPFKTHQPCFPAMMPLGGVPMTGTPNTHNNIEFICHHLRARNLWHLRKFVRYEDENTMDYITTCI